MEAPMFLGLSRSMTPLQKRSALATYALNSESGAFRDPLALEFYKNLVTRDFVDDQGQMRPDAYLLPIEEQYATQILGLPAPSGPHALLESIQASYRPQTTSQLEAIAGTQGGTR